MTLKITCFLPSSPSAVLEHNIDELRKCEMTGEIFVVSGKGEHVQVPYGTGIADVLSFFASETVRLFADLSSTPYLLVSLKAQPFRLSPSSLQRWVQVAEDTGAGMVYADHYVVKNGITTADPVIDHQQGSLRDDFNFGTLLLFRTSAFKETVNRMIENYKYAGWYDLRLKLSQKHVICHLPEYIYSTAEADLRGSSEKQFDYVNPRNREVQLEMEQACTEHLKDIDAWLKPVFRNVDLKSPLFRQEASVIIPVKNRVKTIEDAIQSVLMQQCSFSFNVIIVDNHSTDGTSGIITSWAGKDNRVIHLIPDRLDLGIGGCWNEALFYNDCGRFAIQLDSDDLYIDEHVLAKIVNEFYKQQCAMLVGSYKMVDFNLKDQPPGIIDHREWTPENGRNNALRINGLGAPRAFFTPVARSIQLPNVSYGEDYAIGLQISRHYQIGRIYEPLYLCRRWEDNSDASPDTMKLNAFNFYKDRLRTTEILARQQLVKEGQNKL